MLDDPDPITIGDLRRNGKALEIGCMNCDRRGSSGAQWPANSDTPALRFLIDAKSTTRNVEFLPDGLHALYSRKNRLCPDGSRASMGDKQTIMGSTPP